MRLLRYPDLLAVSRAGGYMKAAVAHRLINQIRDPATTVHPQPRDCTPHLARNSSIVATVQLSASRVVDSNSRFFAVKFENKKSITEH